MEMSFALIVLLFAALATGGLKGDWMCAHKGCAPVELGKLAQRG
jgi:hypothetical protein